MASHDYVFQSRWRVEGTVEEVERILAAPLQLPLWWPSVYLEARRDGENIRVHTRGLLPYTLRWAFRTEGLAVRAWGDLEGEGLWTLRQQGSEVEVVYDWVVRANKPVLRYLSFLLKPIFGANHRWAMARGEESLKIELQRRRGKPAPTPPGPVQWWPVWLLLAFWLWWRRR